MSAAGLHILVADFHDDRAAAVIDRLRADGHDVHRSSDEISARVAVRDHKPDVLIMVLRQDAPSLELARDFRSNLLASTSALVAIGPAGNDSDESYAQAFDAILHEPLDLVQLSGLLHHFCWQRRR